MPVEVPSDGIYSLRHVAEGTGFSVCRTGWQLHRRLAGADGTAAAFSLEPLSNRIACPLFQFSDSPHLFF